MDFVDGLDLLNRCPEIQVCYYSGGAGHCAVVIPMAFTIHCRLAEAIMRRNTSNTWGLKWNCFYLMHTLIARYCFAVGMLFASIQSSMGEEKPAIRIAVASNFAETLSKIVAEFSNRESSQIEIVPGSTGKLYAQIVNGAPYDLLFSADDTTTKQLLDDGLAVHDKRRAYAIGRIALYTSKKTIEADCELTLRQNSFKHFAIANPELAPYGKAASEVISALGLSELLQNKLVVASNISQTLQFVESGAAEYGFVALSQVKQKPEKQWIQIPSELHSPIVQEAALLKHGEANAAAKQLLAFLRDEWCVRVINEAGYETPEPKE